MNDQSERWVDVGRAIEARIRELGMTKAEVLRASGLSDKTLKAYMAGQPIIRADKARGLCAALRWTNNSIERILGGDRPLEVEPDGSVHIRPQGGVPVVVVAQGERAWWAEFIDKLQHLEWEELRRIERNIDSLLAQAAYDPEDHAYAAEHGGDPGPLPDDLELSDRRHGVEPEPEGP